MKKALIAGLVGFSVLFVACGPKKDEAAEKAKLDSIAKIDSAKKVADSLAALTPAAAPVDSAALKAKADSAAKAAAPKAEEKKK